MPTEPVVVPAVVAVVPPVVVPVIVPAVDPPKPGEAGKAGDPPVVEPPIAPAAPEKYELTLPEGGLIDPGDLVVLEKLAREYALSNADAQTFLVRENDRRIEQSTALQVALTADPEYGGAQLPETQRLARLVIDRVRPEGHPRRAAFLRLLDATGHGNHIEVASLFADLGKLMAEDTPVSGAHGGDERKPLANRMYPNQV